MITIVARKERKLVGFDIANDKETERIQELIDDSPKADFYHADGYVSYQEVSYYGYFQHHYDKSETYTVESVNSDLRKYIPFLQRKSKCFLRSLDTARAVLKIFMHAYNKFNQQKQEHPKYKNSYHLTQFI